MRRDQFNRCDGYSRNDPKCSTEPRDFAGARKAVAHVSRKPGVYFAAVRSASRQLCFHAIERSPQSLLHRAADDTLLRLATLSRFGNKLGAGGVSIQ